jgi:hypothetical protein
MAKVKKELMENSVGLKPTTRLAILELTRQDYMEQLEELKKNKANYQYAEYRKVYQRICNIICHKNREIKKLKEEMENGN